MEEATITTLEHPIDAIYLIHKALRSGALQLEEIVSGLDTGASLQPFHLAFNTLATTHVYHADHVGRLLVKHGQAVIGAATGELNEGIARSVGLAFPAVLDEEDRALAIITAPSAMYARFDQVSAGLTTKEHSSSSHQSTLGGVQPLQGQPGGRGSTVTSLCPKSAVLGKIEEEDRAAHAALGNWFSGNTAECI